MKLFGTWASFGGGTAARTRTPRTVLFYLATQLPDPPLSLGEKKNLEATFRTAKEVV